MSLSSKTAARIAWRETRSSMTKFLFVVLAVAAGVGSLVGVRGFSQSFRATLLGESRTIMAADLTARQFMPASQEQTMQLEQLANKGVDSTLIMETVSMASSAMVAMDNEAATPALVSIKAVDPAKYPYYGQVKLDPPISLREALSPDQSSSPGEDVTDKVVVANDVLVRLGVKVGDQLRIGTQTVRIAAVVVVEPDRMSGTLNVGLRLMMSRDAFARTGLMGFGSRGAYRYLFRLGLAAPPVEEVRKSLQAALPDALVADFRQANPIISRGLDRATTFLSLVSLIAMIVGALGVAMAMHAHLQQKMDNVAVLKSLGATSRDVIGIYAIQTLVLGVAGGVVGVVVGKLIERGFPVLISRYFNQIEFVQGWNIGAAVQGITVGILTTLLFTLPPLLSIRKIRPALILRRDMPEARRPWRQRFAEARSALAVGGLILLGIGTVAAWLAESPKVGGYFAGGLTVSLILLSIVAGTLLRLLKMFLRNTSLRIPVLARQGLANLYRQGNQAQAITVALGLGVMFTLTVYLVQNSLVSEIIDSAPPGMPNVFLIGITPDQVEPLTALAVRTKGVEGKAEFLSSVAVQITAINGAPFDGRNPSSPGRRFRPGRSVMFADEKPSSLGVVGGHWWKKGETQPMLSLEEDTAQRLGVKIGDRIEVAATGKTVEARVVAIHRIEQMGPGAANDFVFNPSALEGLPATFYGGLRIKASDVGAFERAAFQQFPTITVINVAEALAILQQVVDQVALVIRFLSAFAILAGAVILSASVAGTRFRRVREVVILKTLGATRRAAGRIFSVEFLMLGAVSGLMGAALASIFARVVLNRLLDAKYAFDGKAVMLAVILTAVLAQLSGWLTSYRILRQKPLEVLRDE